MRGISHNLNDKIYLHNICYFGKKIYHQKKRDARILTFLFLFRELKMNKPRIFADFHNADVKGRVRLNCAGTVKDLACQKISLQEGQSLILYSEDLEVDGVVRHSKKENLWVAVIDWDAIREVAPVVSQTEHHTPV